MTDKMKIETGAHDVPAFFAMRFAQRALDAGMNPEAVLRLAQRRYAPTINVRYCVGKVIEGRA